MKTKLHLTILLALFGLSINAQTTFQKTYGGTGGEQIAFVQQTTDGGYIACGQTTSFGTGGGYLIKTDVNGDTLFTKIYSQSSFSALQQTIDGGYIITGSTSFGAGGGDVLLIKTNSSGDTLWTKTYGGNTADGGAYVLSTSDGGYLVAGQTNSFGAGGLPDIYLIKTNSTGDTTWTKTYGGIYDDFFSSIQKTLDGGYIITGTYSSTIVNYDIYVVKIDVNGNILWEKRYGGNGNEIGHSIVQASSGDYIVAGSTILKLNSTGDTIQTKTYGIEALDIQKTNDNGFVIVGDIIRQGQTYPDVCLIKIDSNLDTIWSKAYGMDGDAVNYFNEEVGYYVRQTNDNGYLIGAIHIDYVGPNSYDVYLIKTDSNGNSGGCNQYYAPFNVTNTSIPVNNTTTQISFGGSVGNAPIILGSGGIDTTLCSNPVGINENNHRIDFLISPNPFSISTTLQTENLLKSATLTLYNSFGQQVKEIKNISGQTVSLHRDNLSSGLYFLRLIQDGKTFPAGRFVIADE